MSKPGVMRFVVSGRTRFRLGPSRAQFTAGPLQTLAYFPPASLWTTPRLFTWGLPWRLWELMTLCCKAFHRQTTAKPTTSRRSRTQVKVIGQHQGPDFPYGNAAAALQGTPQTETHRCVETDNPRWARTLGRSQAVHLLGKFSCGQPFANTIHFAVAASGATHRKMKVVSSELA